MGENIIDIEEFKIKIPDRLCTGILISSICVFRIYKVVI